MMEMGKSLFYIRAKKSLKCAVQANLLIFFLCGYEPWMFYILFEELANDKPKQKKTPVSIACVRWEKGGEMCV